MQKGFCVSYIPDGQVMAVPPVRSFPEPKRFWWRRQPSRPPLDINTFRTFGWLSPEHEFPVDQADPRDVLLLERAVNNSHIFKMCKQGIIKVLIKYGAGFINIHTYQVYFR